MEITNSEIEYILDTKSIAALTTGYTLPPVIFGISDLKLMLKYLIPKAVEVDLTFDDIGLRSLINTNKTIKFTKSLYSYRKLGFTQPHLRVSDAFEGFINKIHGTYKIEQANNIAGIDKIFQNCTNGSIVNSIRTPILFSFK